MNSNIKTVGTLSLVAAILGTILAVPFLGSILNPYNVVSVASGVLSIVILVKIKGTEIKKTASVLTILSAVLGVIGAIIATAMLGAAVAGVSGSMTDAEAAGTALGGLLAGGIFSSLFTFPSWVLLIIGTVLHYINFSKAKNTPEVAYNNTFNADIVNEATTVETETVVNENDNNQN